MSDSAKSRFEVDVQPAELSGSFWHRLAFFRLNLVGKAAAQAVASESGGAVPSVLPGSRIVIRDIATRAEVWHVNSSDITGGTSPEQLRSDIESDLSTLSVAGFTAKWGIRD